jgi:DNA invertase Pin-like site-specific DNA recombinase
MKRMETARKSASSTPRRIAIYARTAADDDAGTACAQQVRELRASIAARAEPTIYADAAHSGVDAERPGLRRLLGAARQGEIDRVLVRDLARLARSPALLASVLGELGDAGVTVETIREDLDA